MTLLEILGMEEIIFYENLGYLSVYALLLIIIGFGIKIIRDGRKFEKGFAQREFFIGLGLFIISVAVGEGIYLSDLVYRTYTGSRLFLPLTSTGSEASWQSIVAYELMSLINRDYYLVVLTVLLLSLSFLMMPLEKFMLKRNTPVITYLNRVLVPFPLILRILEVNMHNFFGIKVLEDSVPYYIFTGCWIFIIAVMAISILLLIGLYLRMGLKAPSGSSLKKKSFFIIIGIIIWIATIFMTANIFREISSGNWYFIPIIPTLLAVSIILLMNGFKREY
ncbi:MAG: hypothetical protein ACOC44_16850 [Promethearchaeia archaeon]